MKTITVILPAFLGLVISFAPTLRAEKDLQKLLIEGIQNNPKIFEFIELNAIGSPTNFEVKLGTSVMTLESGDKFDGFRFKAPKGSEESDFVWYFNAPSNWAHWYLCPVRGEFKPSFRNWLDGDKLYESFDQADDVNRTRILQSLDAGYFKDGEEYIIWFRQIEDGDTQLTGRLLFTKAQDKWDHEKIENALSLEPMPLEVQVKELKSRGGNILLDGDFFDRSYATSRIEDIFFEMRQTKRMYGGFFITMETAIPTCNTDPSFTDIRKRHGEPDFVQTGSEKNTLSSYAGNEADHDPNVVTYYYDYFGFEVIQNDPDAVVERVVTHAHDFSVLNLQSKNPSFAQISMKNLTVFSIDGKEVGRIYYFLEGQKEPLCILAPPAGRYRHGDEALEYLGDEKWEWTTYFKNGSVARQIPFEGHRMNGKAKGFHADGTPSFVAFYKDGALDGKLVKYSEGGEVLEETVFVDGQPQEDTPK